MSKITIVFAAMILLIIACGEKNEIKAPGVSSAGSDSTVIRPDTHTRNAVIKLYNEAIKLTDIKADSIEVYQKVDSTLAWGLNVRFYNRSGVETSHLIADSGLVRENVNIMIANGHVVVVNEDSARLETEQLIYYGNEEMVRTDSFVTIYQDGDTLRGYGMESDQELKRVKIKEMVSGSIRNLDGIDE